MIEENDQTVSQVSMTLESKLESVDIIETKAMEFARHAGFDEDTSSNLAMVVREAAVNAIVHGNKYDPGKHVTATFELTGAAVTYKVADQGAGVDISSIPDPLAPENLLRSSGRGIFLIKALMDEVHFRQLAPGTEITLVKRRAAQVTPHSAA